MKKCPYDEGDQLYTQEVLSFGQGLTVLVGCNGSGKSTLLRQIAEDCKKQNIPVKMFNNLTDGGQRSIQQSLLSGQTPKTAALMLSSEGEQIRINIEDFLSSIGQFLCQLDTSQKQAVILVDALDSGFDVAQLKEIREFFTWMCMEEKRRHNIEVSIIVSTNTYELCRMANCMCVRTGMPIWFPTYDSYLDFIEASRKVKEDRYNHQKNIKEE